MPRSRLSLDKIDTLVVGEAVTVTGKVKGANWFRVAFGGTGLGAPHVPPAKTPLDILRERFAHGEIDKDEFEERRKTLGE